MSNRNIVVDRLRALAMLGVIGIHIGPFVFASSTPRLDLFLLFQVFTRFAVPSFFFISGFGLFCNDALHKPFHYFTFIRKHLVTVGLPYFIWSFFYIAMWQWEDMYRPDRSSESAKNLFPALRSALVCWQGYKLPSITGAPLTGIIPPGPRLTP